MKYAYVVTRIVSELLPGITEIPNLGVHSSYVKAIKHYDSVLKDRAKQFNVKVNNHSLGDFLIKKDRFAVLRSFTTADGEEVRLEKWAVK